jgi:hypothetical protein
MRRAANRGQGRGRGLALPGRWRAALVLWLALAIGHLATPSHAQPISVTAGEHVGFTRIVLNASRGFGWDLTEGETELTLRTDGRVLRLDQARSLDRIPRLRVADLRVDGAVLRLRLACPCPTRIFEDRPGVLVLDVLDPVPDPVAQAAGPAPDDPPLPPRAPQPLDATGLRDIGRALAVSLAAETAPVLDEPRGSVADPAIMAGLSRHLAMAMTQGLVSPPDPVPPQPGLLGPAAPGIAVLPDLPANLRLRNASDALPQEPDAPPSTACPAEEVLAFATVLRDPSFTEPLATLNQRLFGEFDTPDPEALIALIEHYLSWGFGAEARLLLDSATVPLPGRNVLSAIADIVEGRQSNARQRLAALGDCPGQTALFATLAAAGTTLQPARAEALAVAYQRLTPSLRAVLGPDLIDALLARGPANAARIALEAFRHAVPPEDPELLRLTAELDRVRNDPVRAEQRLGSADPAQIGPLRLRLEIALAEGTPLSADLLADAVALAAAQRREEQGRRLMELVILHQAQAGRVGEGFENLGILAGWLGPSGSAIARLEALRDRLWQGSLTLADPELLDLILSRDDWRGPGRTAEFLLGLAQRFDALGLESLARETRQRSDMSAIADRREQTAASAPIEANGMRPAQAAGPRDGAQGPPDISATLAGTAGTRGIEGATAPPVSPSLAPRTTSDQLATAATLDIDAEAVPVGEPVPGSGQRVGPRAEAAPGAEPDRPETEVSLSEEGRDAPATASAVGSVPAEGAAQDSASGGRAEAGREAGREAGPVSPVASDRLQPAAGAAPDAMTRGVAALAEAERLRAMLADLDLQRR